MTEVVKAGSTSTSTGSVQSTPTPPSSGQSVRSRRSARKCATPIKSAEKVEKDERVSLHQLSLTDTSSTNTTITPDSSNLIKAPGKVGGGLFDLHVYTCRACTEYPHYIVCVQCSPQALSAECLPHAFNARFSLMW